MDLTRSGRSRMPTRIISYHDRLLGMPSRAFLPASLRWLGPFKPGTAGWGELGHTMAPTTIAWTRYSPQVNVERISSNTADSAAGSKSGGGVG
jgi:hypothetical protein